MSQTVVDVYTNDRSRRHRHKYYRQQPTFTTPVYATSPPTNQTYVENAYVAPVATAGAGPVIVAEPATYSNALIPAPPVSQEIVIEDRRPRRYSHSKRYHDDRDRERRHSRHGSHSSSRGSRTVEEDEEEYKPKLDKGQAIKAAVIAGGIEAFRSRKEYGGITGPDALMRAGQAAAAAGAADLLINRAHREGDTTHEKRHLAEAVVGGLAAQRALSGAPGTGSRPGGHGAVKDLAKLGIGLTAANKLLDMRSKRKENSYAEKHRSRSVDRNGKSSSSSDSEVDSDEEAKKLKRMKRKQLITGALATVASVHAAHELYETKERRDHRRELLREGKITKQQAEDKRVEDTMSDLAALGLAVIGTKGAIDSWKELRELRHEQNDIAARLEERHSRQASRSSIDRPARRARSADGKRRHRHHDGYY